MSFALAFTAAQYSAHPTPNNFCYDDGYGKRFKMDQQVAKSISSF